MINYFKKNWQILLPEIFIIFAFAFFYGRFGDIVVDSFREAYIPQQMLAGKVLYKDIFTIYAPFAYQFNAFLYLIFGINLKVLYFAGLICTIGIFYFVNKIAIKFFSAFEVFAVLAILFSALVLSPNVFNPFFPYSYGILYGLLFVLMSIYFALYRKFPYSYFCYSLAVLSKYEFIFLLPLLLYTGGLKNWKKNLAAFVIPLIASFICLHGAGITDFITSAGLILQMGAAKTLYWFYSSMGLAFRIELIPLYIINFIKFLVPVYWVLYQEVFIWAFPAILILFIIKFKALGRREKFFIAASLLISVKVFFALTIQSYGVFFLPFALISLGILTPSKFKRFYAILLIIWAIVIGGFNVNNLIKKNYEIKTGKGIIKTAPYYGQGIQEVIKYLQYSNKDSRVVVFPEALSINFLSDRKSDDKFYSLIPLYVETFGENIIIKRLELIKPDYIVISDYDTSAYYFKQFGLDYASEIKRWILENYKQEKVIHTGLTFEIYSKLLHPSP